MQMTELMGRLERVIDQAKAAVLATVDPEGSPHMRWMTPAVLHGHEGVLYAVTSPRFAKVGHLQSNPAVSWMVQTPSLDEVISVQGRVNLVDNPSLKAEISEAVGKQLRMFWKVNVDQTDVVVLETVIETASCFHPMTGKKETLSSP